MEDRPMSREPRMGASPVHPSPLFLRPRFLTNKVLSVRKKLKKTGQRINFEVFQWEAEESRGNLGYIPFDHAFLSDISWNPVLFSLFSSTVKECGCHLPHSKQTGRSFLIQAITRIDKGVLRLLYRKKCWTSNGKGEKAGGRNWDWVRR